LHSIKLSLHRTTPIQGQYRQDIAVAGFTNNWWRRWHEHDPKEIMTSVELYIEKATEIL